MILNRRRIPKHPSHHQIFHEFQQELQQNSRFWYEDILIANDQIVFLQLCAIYFDISNELQSLMLPLMFPNLLFKL
jgi:hypothetical protein